MRPLILVLVVAAVLSADPRVARAADRDTVVAAAVARGVAWVENVEISPFAEGAPSLRMYTMEIEARHRIWLLEADPARRAQVGARIKERLSLVLDEARVESALSGEGGSGAFTEIAVLSDRCRQHGLDPTPLCRSLLAHRATLQAEVEKVPPSVRLLYAAYLPSCGIDLGLSPSALRTKGMLANRPNEVSLTLTDVYYLTHEIFAYTDYGTKPLPGLSDGERGYLLRVLPFFTVFYAAWNNLDLVGELLACLWAADMKASWGYEEGIRVILERQNLDGSFGGPDPRTLDRPVLVEEVLHPTMNCLTALLLDASTE